MYLSNVEILPLKGNGMMVISDFYSAHRFVSSAFDDQDYEAAKEGRPLFRIEKGETGARLLVQSPSKPDWDRAKRLNSISTANIDVKAFKPEAFIHDGQRIHFRLRANPIKTIRDGEKRREENRVKKGNSNSLKRVRVPLIREDEQRRWLINRAENAGMSDISMQIRDEGHVVQGGPLEKRRKNAIHLYSVQFDGIARVNDSKALVNAIRNGIGPAKGFGFGLLSVVPAGSGR